MQANNKQYVWLDCDPGLDDTMAIVLAAKTEQIELLGVSTSAGNTSIDNTTKNALDILHNIQRSDVPVVKGSSELVHGVPHIA
jgi:inosine-uridine nucleoside N-ribohydrolase